MHLPNSVGVRELRNQVASVLRRAQSGDRMVVTVDGQPIAQLGPLEPTGGIELADLVAVGRVRAPGRNDHPEPPDAALLPVDLLVGTVLDEIRG